MEASGHAVEVVEAGLEAAEGAFVFVEVFDAVETFCEDVLEENHVGLLVLIADGEELLFGLAEELFDPSAFVEAEGGNVGAGLDEAAADGGVGDDFGVGGGVGGGGDVSGEFGKIGGATNFGESF